MRNMAFLFNRFQLASRAGLLGGSSRWLYLAAGIIVFLAVMASARICGVTPSGNRYDLPDVPWVLPFWCDYTIHGAYWRRGFGFPQSNGCVSLPVPVAKQVFDWATVGTPVVIHY